MILAELPVLYNYADFKLTPQEYEVFHKNALDDALRLAAQDLEPPLHHHLGDQQRIPGRS